MNTIVKVSDFTKFALSEEAGLSVRKRILELWDEQDVITVDFNGISIFATPFFNSSLGYCILTYGPDSYLNKINVVGLNLLGEETYKHSKENAIDFYTKNLDKIEISKITNKTIEDA